jgi:hypothetical protein
VSFVIDNASYLGPDIEADAQTLRDAGVDVYAKNGYWTAPIVDGIMPNMPSDMPLLVAEWSGSEGSDRGPIGEPGTKAFPDNTYPWGGVYTEAFQAFTMVPFLVGWYTYVGCSNPGTPCVSGLVYFTYQDVEWPGMPYFYPGHYSMLRSGLVYEDRTPKAWPLAIFSYLMQFLP